MILRRSDDDKADKNLHLCDDTDADANIDADGGITFPISRKTPARLDLVCLLWSLDMLYIAPALKITNIIIMTKDHDHHLTRIMKLVMFTSSKP